MTICPIALAVGCEKCPAFKFCPLTTVLGDQEEKDEIDPSNKVWEESFPTADEHLDEMYLVICNLKDKWIAKDISTFNDKEERIYKDICFVELKYNALRELDPDIVYPYQVNFYETAMEIVEGTIMSILLDEDRLKDIPPAVP